MVNTNKLRGVIAQNGKPQSEVAKMLGISRSYISRLENKAIKTLKDALKGKNIFE